jgi:hypothetical protein
MCRSRLSANQSVLGVRRVDVSQSRQARVRKRSARPIATAGPNGGTTAPSALTRSTIDAILEDCDPTSLSWLEWRSKSGHYISGEELAVAIEANAGQPLPDGLRDYLCRYLRGKIKRKRGPKGSDREFRFLIEFLANAEYRKELRRLQMERKVRGRQAIAEGVLSPHEEAVRIIKERFRIRFAGVTPERVANILSSHN